MTAMLRTSIRRRWTGRWRTMTPRSATRRTAGFWPWSRWTGTWRALQRKWRSKSLLPTRETRSGERARPGATLAARLLHLAAHGPPVQLSQGRKMRSPPLEVARPALGHGPHAFAEILRLHQALLLGELVSRGGAHPRRRARPEAFPVWSGQPAAHSPRSRRRAGAPASRTPRLPARRRPPAPSRTPAVRRCGAR